MFSRNNISVWSILKKCIGLVRESWLSDLRASLLYVKGFHREVFIVILGSIYSF